MVVTVNKKKDPFEKILKRRKIGESPSVLTKNDFPIKDEETQKENGIEIKESDDELDEATKLSLSIKAPVNVKTINRTTKIVKSIKNPKENKPFRLIDPELPTNESKPLPMLPTKKNSKLVKDKHTKRYTIATDTKKSIRDYTDKELTEKHKRADQNLFTSWRSIIDKYEKLGDVDNGSDIIDLHTGRIIEDNGHIKSLAQQDTLKANDTKNKLTKSHTCNDDDFLDGLVKENVVKEAVRRKLDLRRLKTDGVLTGLDLDLSESDSDFDSADESYSMDSDEYSTSESDFSDVEVDDEIEGKDYVNSEEEEEEERDDYQLSEIEE